MDRNSCHSFVNDSTQLHRDRDGRPATLPSRAPIGNTTNYAVALKCGKPGRCAHDRVSQEQVVKDITVLRMRHAFVISPITSFRLAMLNILTRMTG